ncbi:MAG: YopX family protein [Ruminococcus sp.]
MMREYLFRGKMIANGNWSEGNLLVTKQGCCITPDATVLGSNVAVNPETVGQYTGMKDKNGKRIFEGDIIDFSDRSYSDGYGVVRYDAEGTEFEFVYDDHYEGLGRCYYPEDVEVIGNIYDNPNLVRGDY